MLGRPREPLGDLAAERCYAVVSLAGVTDAQEPALLDAFVSELSAGVLDEGVLDGLA